MENTQNELQNEESNSGNVINNNPSDKRPDEVEQNDTGYAGTTNEISENHQESDEYEPAIEDTMIGYDGDESDLETDAGTENLNSENTRSIDDND